MTDDQFSGFITVDLSSDDVHIEHLPTWLSESQIVFGRMNIFDNDNIEYQDGFHRDLRLMQLDVNSGEVNQLHDLSDFRPYISVLETSPNQDALLLWLYKDSNTSGLWIYDLLNNQLERFIPVEDILETINALPVIQSWHFQNPISALWTADGNIILSSKHRYLNKFCLAGNAMMNARITR